MLSPKDLADIVKHEIENEIRKVEILVRYYTCYYILLNGKMYPGEDYDKEVAEGKRSPNNIYAYVNEWNYSDFDSFLFDIDYLAGSSVNSIVDAYLRKMGFTLEYFGVLPPTPNLKYYIHVGVKLNGLTPEYLVVNIYDIDALARIFHIPQIVQQKLGNKPGKITLYEGADIYAKVTYRQPLLAGHTYKEAWDILYDYYIHDKKEYHAEASKIALAYMKLFPISYPACYEWHKVTQMFIETNRLKIELHKRLKRSS